jgi:hypothetical protein
MALAVWSMAIFIIAKIYYVRRNKYVNPCTLIGLLLLIFARQNAAIWDNMSSEERSRYVAENKDLGNKRFV